MGSRRVATATRRPEEAAGWWRSSLIAAGAMAAFLAAAIAWGRASPPAEPRSVVPGARPSDPVPAGREAAPEPPWVRRRIGWTVGLVVTVAVALVLLGRLRDVLSYVLLALFFSFALEPAVNFLHARRGWRRGSATGLLLATVFVVFVLIVLIFVPVLIRSAMRVAQEVPGWADRASAWAADNLGIDVATESFSDDAEGALRSLRSSLDSPVSTLVGFSSSLIGGIFGWFTVGMFLFYMLAEGPKFKRAVLSFFAARRQEELVSIWEAAIEKTGGYFYSKLLLMAINGALFFVVLHVLDVPGAAGLALFQAFVAEFIPIVGTYVAAIVPLLAAMFSVGVSGTLILLVYVLIFQQVENYWLTPRVQGKTMQLHPAVAFGAALAGAAIGGLLWAFLALPFAATVQASASLWIRRHEVSESGFTEDRTPTGSGEKRPSIGEQVGRLLRSTRGWLRRTDEPHEARDSPA